METSDLNESETSIRTALADRYSIEQEIGSGGMATVYLARDLKHPRDVAVKVLRPEVAILLGVERFLREIRIAANLHHPHILPLHDSGEAAGFLYYVMPYVAGRSLRDRLVGDDDLPVTEVVRILRDVVDALSHAHQEGVVHRDIKPDNVMLSGRHALVADFGIAKAMTDATGKDQLKTTGFPLGTRVYMAPEQALGNRSVDHRADIYAVGVLAYELLTGRAPFFETTPLPGSSGNSSAALNPVSRYRESVPPALEQLVLRCLAQDPADRWQRAEDLLSQLEAMTTPSGGVAPTVRVLVGNSGLAAQRKKVLWAAAGVAAVLAVVAVTIVLSRESGVPLDPNRVVVAVFNNETGDTSLDAAGVMAGHWITQGLQQATVMEAVPWLDAQQASRYITAEAAAGRVRNPVRALAEEVGAGTIVAGSYYRRADMIQFQVEVTNATEGRVIGALGPEVVPLDSQQLAVERLQERVLGLLAVTSDERLATRSGAMGRPPTFQAYRAFEQGIDRYIRSEFQEAVPHFTRAFELDTTFALALQYQAITHYALYEYRQADSVLSILATFLGQLTDLEAAWVEYLDAGLDGDHERALQAIRRAAEIAPHSKAAYNRALVAVNTNRPQEAVDALRTLDPERGPMRGWIGYWSVLCTALHEVGEHERELQAARRIRELFPDLVANSYLHEALALAPLGNMAELNRLLDEVALLPPVGGYTAGSIMPQIADDLRGHGYLAEGREVLERAIGWFETRTSERSVTAVQRYEYGRTLYLARHWGEAEHVFEDLLEESPHDIDYRGQLGVLAARRGDREGALRISEWMERVDQPYSFGLPQWWQARIAAVLGERDRAMALLHEAQVRGHVDDWHTPVIDFESLRDYLPFQEFMRPKG
jgi:tetratricopeptide (TPR) repeat protein